RLPLETVGSEGYSFVVELTFLAAVNGLTMAESPIIFIERREGASKLSSGVLLESLKTPWRLTLKHGRVRPHTAGGAAYTPPASATSPLPTTTAARSPAG